MNGYQVSNDEGPGSAGWLNTHVTCKGHASESDREASCTLFSDINLTLNNLASSDLYLCSDYAAHQLEHGLHHSSTVRGGSIIPSSCYYSVLKSV